MLGMVGDMHLKVREELICGRYDWFKPIYATNIEASMIKANKDLQDVIDNGHLVRGHASKKFMKEGKIFTFQGNEPLTYWTSEYECIHEDIDNKGNGHSNQAALMLNISTTLRTRTPRLSSGSSALKRSSVLSPEKTAIHTLMPPTCSSDRTSICSSSD
jgi:hypothetical protein